MKKWPLIPKQSLFFSSLIFFSLLAKESYCLPQEAQLISGQAEIKEVHPKTVEIKVSDKAILRYQDFSIGHGEKVSFIQPSSKSTVLNKVVGQKVSTILGKLESNGKVFLVNPNGIYFGKESQVNVGSLIASTLDIQEEDFLKENYKFSLRKNYLGQIENEGALIASNEGAIVLMGSRIQNNGLIQAKLGNVALLSGEHVTLDFTGDGLFSFSVEGVLKDSLLENLGKIDAEGGIVSLKTATAQRAISEIVNHEGIEEGAVFIEEGGKILLVSESLLLAKQAALESGDVILQGKIKAEEVTVFGKEIALIAAEIDGSKTGDGGKILIGGEFQGRGKSPYASNIFMDSSSQIFANSLDAGDGGLVVLWSKNSTDFQGAIEAKGGIFGGSGGVVETSSMGGLRVNLGKVNTLSPYGKAGEWLLDPTNVYIQTSGSSCSLSGQPGCDIFDVNNICYGGCNSGSDCYIDVSAINNATTSVTIQAYNYVYLNTDINMVNSGVGVVLGNCSTSYTQISGNITTNGGTIGLSGNKNYFTAGNWFFDSTNGGGATCWKQRYSHKASINCARCKSRYLCWYSRPCSDQHSGCKYRRKSL